MHFRKPALIPLLFIMASTLLLGSLGVWQLSRLEWKVALNNSITEAQAMPALGSLPESLDGLAYRSVALTGQFLGDKALHMAGGVQGEEYGHFIYMPFVLDDDGRVIMVNRGFAPKGENYSISGPQTIHGVLRPARQKRMFTPESQPEKNIWFNDDLTMMSQAVGTPLLPLIVEIHGKREPGVYPIPHSGNLLLRNDHLAYAFQWFAIMLAGLVMFAIYHRKPKA